MTKLESLFRYARVSKDIFPEIEGDINEANRSGLHMASAVAFTFMLLLVVASFFLSDLSGYRFVYGFAAVPLLALCAFTHTPAMKNTHISRACVFIFIAVLLLSTLYIAVMPSANKATASFFVILLTTPLLFTMAPWRMDLFIAIMMALYLFVELTAPGENSYLQLNLVNLFIYGFISMLISTYAMCIKCDRFSLIRQSKVLSECDHLTSFLNRRCFEDRLQQLREEENIARTTMFVLDINGLKAANDNLGHVAGDELILGAADCISKTYGPYGTCYRIGGDEFAVILQDNAPDPAELNETLRKHTQAWRGTRISSLSISVGWSTAHEFDTIDELLNNADLAMYKAKARYYSENKIDRRRE